MSKVKKIVLGTVGLIILFIVGMLSIFGYLFSDVLIEEYAAIEVKQLPQKNPTTYVFDASLEQVRGTIVSGNESSIWDSPFQYELGGVQHNLDFYVCEAKDEICLSSNDKQVEEIFSKPENKNDVYLASDGHRIPSTLYYAVGKPLEFRADFHVHLEAKDGNKTIVTIFPVEPAVYKGYGGLGLHGAILKKEIPVEPTTVEEYQLLRYIGSVLGETDMPEVVLPR